jgi:hypothetical protein
MWVSSWLIIMARAGRNLTRLPLVRSALQNFPPENRVGSMMIYEIRPTLWSGHVPADMARPRGRHPQPPAQLRHQNTRDHRVDLAGRRNATLQKHTMHSDPKTSRRYIRSTARKAPDNVATLRVKGRETRMQAAFGVSEDGIALLTDSP